MKSSCKAFSQLVINGGGDHDGCPGFYKKAVLASHEKQASNQHPNMASISVPEFLC